MPTRKAFTLIELLVVISVIVLLMSLLLPALSRVRERAAFAQWVSYSHALAVDPSLRVYYDFQPAGVDDTEVPNRAAGDPFDHAKDHTDFERWKGVFHSESGSSDPLWVPNGTRWGGKGGVELDGSGNSVQLQSRSMRMKARPYSIMISFNKRTGDATKDLVGITPAPQPSLHGILLEASTGQSIRFLHRNPIGNAGGANFNSTLKYEPGRWTQLVATMEMDSTDKNVMTTYLNGRVAGTVTSGGSYPLFGENTMMRVALGQIGVGYSGRWFDGAIDEFALFNRLLTPEQVAEMHRVGAIR